MFDQQNIDNQDQFKPAKNIENPKRQKIKLTRIYNIDEVTGFIDEIQCPVCHFVLMRPQYCNKCGKCFCSECQSSNASNFQEVLCVCCKQQLKKSDSQHIPKLFFTLLNKLQLWCENKELGCSEIIKYDQLEKHEEQSCQFTQVSCDNQQCTKIVCRKDLKLHKIECPFQLVSCSECKNEVLNQNLNDHLLKECLQRKVCCQWCAQVMQYRTFLTHQHNCSSKYQTCSKCNSKYTKEEYYFHTIEQCLTKQKEYFQQKYEQEKEQNQLLIKKAEHLENLIFVLTTQLEEMDLKNANQFFNFNHNGNQIMDQK